MTNSRSHLPRSNGFFILHALSRQLLVASGNHGMFYSKESERDCLEKLQLWLAHHINVVICQDRHNNIGPCIWRLKLRVVMTPYLSSLVAPQIVIITTWVATSDDKVGIMTTLSFQSVYCGVVRPVDILGRIILYFIVTNGCRAVNVLYERLFNAFY